jgi:pilus assembly protein CpaE
MKAENISVGGRLPREAAAGGNERMSSVGTNNPESISMNALSVLLLGASDDGRQRLATAFAGTQAQVVKSAPLPGVDALPSLLQDEYDILVVDLDLNPELALEVVETALGIRGAMTVMVYSQDPDRELLVRCMQAGAREFLNDPLSAGSVTEALVRASVRRDELKRLKKTGGKCLVFVGAKGGSGVTTLASNFAVALAIESRQSVALLDLNLPFGDAALNLGLASEYSTLDALQNEQRLDAELLSKLMVTHSSGLKVLAASDEQNDFQPPASAVLKLVNLLRNDFAWLVVDAGTHYGGYAGSLFDIAEKVYLVTQVSLPELRNSHRLITRNFKGEARRKLDIVMNRFAPRADDIGEDSIEKALLGLPEWRVPSDFQAVRRAQNAATALVAKDSYITRVIFDMARAASGKKIEAKKKKFGLF